MTCNRQSCPQTRPLYQIYAGSGAARPGTESATGKYCFCRAPDPGLQTAKQAPLQQNDSGTRRQHKQNLISSQQTPSTDFRWDWWVWDQVENTGDPCGSIPLEAQRAPFEIRSLSPPFWYKPGVLPMQINEHLQLLPAVKWKGEAAGPPPPAAHFPATACAARAEH